MTKTVSALALIFFTTFTYCQISNKSFTVKHTSDNIIIDGVLDEAVWTFSESAGEFQQYFPADNVPAQYQTDIRMLTDDTTLYVGLTVYTPGSNYIIPSLERDLGQVAMTI